MIILLIIAFIVGLLVGVILGMAILVIGTGHIIYSDSITDPIEEYKKEYKNEEIQNKK